MRATTARVLLATTFIAAAALAACSYSPSFESGTLMCGPGASCPEDYHCMASYCYRDGEVTGAAGSSGGSGGRGGAGGGLGGTGGTDPRTKFVGRWTFVAPAQRVTVCSGVSDTVRLPVDADDFISIELGAGGSLAGFYYCDWNLTLNGTGTATMLPTGQSCSALDSSQVPPVTFTWTGESFTLTTSNGTSGTIDASIPYSYTSTAGTGTCTAKFSGPVMKN